MTLPRWGSRPVGDLAQRRRGHHGGGAAVLDDVAGLLGLEVPVDRRAVEPGAHRRPEHLEVAGVVLEQDRQVVAGPQPGVVQQLRQPHGPLVELRVRDDGATARHHDRRLVALRRHVISRVHPEMSIMNSSMGSSGDSVSVLAPWDARGRRRWRRGAAHAAGRAVGRGLGGRRHRPRPRLGPGAPRRSRHRCLRVGPYDHGRLRPPPRRRPRCRTRTCRRASATPLRCSPVRCGPTSWSPASCRVRRATRSVPRWRGCGPASTPARGDRRRTAERARARCRSAPPGRAGHRRRHGPEPADGHARGVHPPTSTAPWRPMSSR